MKQAFQYFLENFSKGRPFIIASHSQGTHHAIRLLKEEIDGSSNITIEGMAFSDQDILNFISNLNEKSLIDQASLVAMKVDEQDSNSNKKGFTILCKLKQS